MKYTNFAILALTGKVTAAEVERYLNADSFDDNALAQAERELSSVKRDTFDNDQDTAGMYDDGWVYSQPGKFSKGPIVVGKFPPGGGKQVETVMNPAQQSLSHAKKHHHHHRNKRDSFDNDQDTSSMYDDGWVYSQPGKFSKGPIVVGKSPPGGGKQVETVLNPAQQSLRQIARSRRDSYDHDPTTSSMYDDGHQYSAPGALNWKFAGGPKAEYDAAKASKPEAGPVEVLTQHKHHHKHHRNAVDSFDHDGDTSSMYDDQHVYSKPGKNWALSPKEKKEKEADDKLTMAGAAAPAELAQHRHHHRGQDSFDADPTTASMYDDGDKVKTYSPAGAGKLNWKFAGGPKAEYDAAPAKDKAPVEVLSQHRRNHKKGHHAHHRHIRNNG